MIRMKFFLVTLAPLISTSTAWINPPTSVSPSSSFRSTSHTQLFNIPPPSTTDKIAFKAFADKQSPPASFFELQQDCIRSAKLAIDDGCLLLEVEFPPLPANVLELDDVSAYDVASANLNLAIEFAKGFSTIAFQEEALSTTLSGQIRNVGIMLPDEDEARIAIERMTGKRDQYIAPTVQVERGITISSLRRSDEADDRIIKVC